MENLNFRIDVSNLPTTSPSCGFFVNPFPPLSKTVKIKRKKLKKLLIKELSDKFGAPVLKSEIKEFINDFVDQLC